MWFVTIDDDDRVVQTVRPVSGPTSENELLLVGQLKPDAARKLALEAGQPSTFP